MTFLIIQTEIWTEAQLNATHSSCTLYRFESTCSSFYWSEYAEEVKNGIAISKHKKRSELDISNGWSNDRFNWIQPKILPVNGMWARHNGYRTQRLGVHREKLIIIIIHWSQCVNTSHNHDYEESALKPFHTSFPIVIIHNVSHSQWQRIHLYRPKWI